MQGKPTVPVETFLACDLRVARVLACDPFPAAKVPAYQLTLDLGPLGTRRSSARLPTWYAPADLVGRLVVVVANFPSKQVGPMRSEVLVLGAVRADGEVVLLQPDKDVELGSPIA